MSTNATAQTGDTSARILALEGDSTQAARIGHMVRDHVHAQVTIVSSVDAALEELRAGRAPDVILVPTFFSPADETALLEALRNRAEAAHIELLITPLLTAATAPRATEAVRGWRSWRTRSAPTAAQPDETLAFAERLKWTLQLVKERRQSADAGEEGLVYGDLLCPDSPSEAVIIAAEIPARSDPSEKRSKRPARRTPPAPVQRRPPPEPVVVAPFSKERPHEPAARTPPPAPVATSSPSRSVGTDRRHHVRIRGPFDGRWRGAVDTPIVINDISEGGCFVNSHHEMATGRAMALTIDLSGGGAIAVKGQVVHSLPGFGFAVRFVEVPDTARDSLARFVAARRAHLSEKAL